MLNFRTSVQGWPNSTSQEGYRIRYGLARGSHLCIHIQQGRATELTRTPWCTKDLKLPWYVLQTYHIMCVKCNFWDYSDNESRKYFPRGLDNGRSPLVNEFGHGLCVASIYKIANNATNRLLICRKNACCGFIIPLFFDIWRTMIGLVRLCIFFSVSYSPLRSKVPTTTKRY